MGKKLAKILSASFHPLLLPTVGMLILFNSGSILEFLPFQAKKIILLIVFVSTFVLPLTFVPFFIFQKIIKNVKMENNKERLVPFFVTSILYFFCYYMLERLGAPKPLSNFILASASCTFMLFLLSFKWKISAHMVGIGGLTGALITASFILNVNLEYFIVASILLSGILGYSRLKLETHKQYQIYVGWFAGAAISSIILFFF